LSAAGLTFTLNKGDSIEKGARMTNKELVKDVLRGLPEDVSLEKIREEIAILAAIRRGAADIDAGRIVTHEEVKRRSVQ
jgi:predicted transcriptional regulator